MDLASPAVSGTSVYANGLIGVGNKNKVKVGKNGLATSYVRCAF